MKVQLLRFCFVLFAISEGALPLPGQPSLLPMPGQLAASAPFSGASIRASQRGISIRCLGDTTELGFSPAEVAPFTQWQAYSRLEFVFHNRGKHSVELIVRLRGKRNELAESFVIRPGKPAIFTVNLSELTLIGYTDAPEMIFLRILEGKDARLEWISCRLAGGPDALLRPLVDSFGQRKLTDWPGKVFDTQTLLALAKEEELLLEKGSPPARQDRYGGWIAKDSYPATGFFRLEKGPQTSDSTQAWHLITPEGNPFWSFGVTGVRNTYPLTDVTRVTGREALYEALPPQQGHFASAWESDEYVSFYTWNILRKWGSLEKWREVTFLRLQQWGMNTLGNWAGEDVLASAPMPYTRALRSNQPPAPCLGETSIPDVFDPAWAITLDQVFASAADWKNDSLLLGYFVDNEMPWGHLRLLEVAGAKAALRQEWAAFLKAKYGSLASLNATWNSDYSEWERVALTATLPEACLSCQTDLQDFEALFAETYFAAIARTLKKHDPNHLYLGCRFTRALKPAYVVAAGGRHCDVLSVNVYSYAPDPDAMRQWHRLSGGLPILIGEHHVPLKSPRQLAPRYAAFSADNRQDYFENYVLTWAAMPFAVGSHWYQYKDQPLTGRGATPDGENQVIGLVDITDTPHPELINAIRVISRQLPQLRAPYLQR